MQRKKSNKINQGKKKKKYRVVEVDTTKPAWKKIKGGTHYHSDGQKVKRGEILYADEWEIASPIVSKMFEPVDKREVPIKKKKVLKEVVNTLEIMKSPKNEDMYDVVNVETGDTLNDVPLSKEDAKFFKEDMS